MAVDIRVNYLQNDPLGRPFGRDAIMAALDKYKVENAVLVSGFAVTCDFREGNKQLWEAIKDDDRLFGCLVVNPNYTSESIELMRTEMSRRKFVAVALFQGASRPYPNVDDYRDILNAYRRFSKPVFVDTPHAAAADAAKQIAAEFPGVQFIFGSMGGADWRRALDIGKLLNVHMETSGSFDVEKIEMAVERLGAHRVLFGSDLPHSDPAAEIALIRSSSIPESDMRKIFGENALSLLKLRAPAPVEEEPAEE